MTEPIRIFCGTDEREAIGLPVFCSSVWRHASEPVSITPISHKALSDGTNAFTMSRFLVPFLCSYRGWAIWADGSDMLCRADIAELWREQRFDKAVMVVKHDYKTRHPVKYLRQKNYDYERKNWSSLMLINCSHFGWRNIRPDSIKDMPGVELHRFNFLKDEWIGGLDKEWNYLCQEELRPYDDDPKLIHFTIGLPVWKEYSGDPYAWDWRNEKEMMLRWQKD